MVENYAIAHMCRLLSPTTVKSLHLHLESFQLHQEQQSCFLTISEHVLIATVTLNLFHKLFKEK